MNNRFLYLFLCCVFYSFNLFPMFEMEMDEIPDATPQQTSGKTQSVPRNIELPSPGVGRAALSSSCGSAADEDSCIRRKLIMWLHDEKKIPKGVMLLDVALVLHAYFLVARARAHADVVDITTRARRMDRFSLEDWYGGHERLRKDLILYLRFQGERELELSALEAERLVSGRSQ